MNKVAAVLDQIEAQQQTIAVPDDIPLMELADRVVRGKVQLTPPQQRMLIEMLPYIAPKLSARANIQYDGTFAAQLERAIERSKSPLMLNPPKTIEHEPLPASVLKKPFARNYRRF